MLIYDQLSTFRLIQSHRNEEGVRLLVEFLDILKEGLPNININFLYNAVFNCNHENLLYIYREKVIGGICLKNSGVEYIKIEYFVVDADHRQKGFGRLLMNVLKSTLSLIFRVSSSKKSTIFGDSCCSKCLQILSKTRLP